jgi:hypothetical protein
MHRNFDESEAFAAIPPAGPEFELGGETFHCVACPAGGTLSRLVAAAKVDERGRQAVNNPDLALFIEDVLAEELAVPQERPDDAEEGWEPGPAVVEPCDDVPRWRVLMDDKSRPIPAQVIGDICTWLFEWYSQRPTTPPRR